MITKPCKVCGVEFEAFHPAQKKCAEHRVSMNSKRSIRAANPKTTLSQGDFAAFLNTFAAQMAQQSADSKQVMAELMTTMVQKLREPTEEELRLRQKEQDELEKRKAIRRAEVQAEYTAKAAREAACSHKKENGKPSVSGQIMTGDGLYHPICQRCGKQFTPFAPTPDVLNGATTWSFGTPAQQ